MTLTLFFLPLLISLLSFTAQACRSPDRNEGDTDLARADRQEGRYRRSYRSERKVEIEKPSWEEISEEDTTAAEVVSEAQDQPAEAALESIAEKAREFDPPVVKPPRTTEPEIGERKQEKDTLQEPPARSSWEDEFIKDMQGVIDAKTARGAMSLDLARRFPVADEIQIGEGVSARILSGAKELHREALWEYVNFVGLALVEGSTRLDLAYHFVVLDEPDDINAFAAPGGFVFITSGAIRFCRNEAELAAILAHEIAHVSLRHGIRSLDRAKYRVIMEMMVQEMDDAGKRMFDGQWNRPRSEEIEKELIGIADDCYNQTQNPYSQSLEDEADGQSLKLLDKAGYNPHAAIMLLERLDRRADGEPGFTKALRSHPAPSERVASLKGAAAAMGIRNQGRLNKERFAPYLEMLEGGR